MTITLPAELERKVEAAATEGGETPETLVNRILAEALAPVFVRPTEPPAWLEQVQPRTPPTDGTNGLNRLVGRWPGEESDKEVSEALERLS